ncbi:MAG: YjbQ family protein [Chloroflexi bacterium]|nr:YjbQ family protein [Chloroflexota bacterium]
MAWFQKSIRLTSKPRGIHLVTSEIVRQLADLAGFRIGLAHIFIQHTSASLALNENADPTVRLDMEAHFNQMVPENMPYYIHTYEGADDMPAHIKAAMIGPSLTIPISNGRLNLGTWQGIYLCEHRDRAGGRRLVVTLHGEG